MTIDAIQTTGRANVLAELRRVFATGRTRALEWRLEQLRGIERFVEERESEIAEALAEDLGRSPVRRGSVISLQPRAKLFTHANI